MTARTKERKGPPKSLKDKSKSGGKKTTEEKRPYSFGAKAGVVITIALGICLGVYFKPTVTQMEPSSSISVTLASADKTQPQWSYPVQCSDDYKKEKFTECKPRFCGRVVMDGLVSDDEANYLLSVAKKGLAFGGGSGGASILDLHSGALSKKDKFIDIYSILSEEGGFTDEDFKIYTNVKNKIHGAISKYFNIQPSKLYLTKPTFFSRMNTTEAKTPHDEYWHHHIDKIQYGSFHYTSLLYLTTYGTNFTGGRFVFVDGDKEKAVEPRLGRVSFFTSGSENVHYVEKLESGVRYAITISFTCDPKMAISDPAVRNRAQK